VPAQASAYDQQSCLTKESVVSSAWAPIVNRLKRELGRPVRILNNGRVPLAARYDPHQA
jgi:hypothetical protein